MNFTVTDTKKWLRQANHNISEQKEYLTALDSTIGDGDHGINMARGFKAIAENLNDPQSNQLHSVAEVMKLSAHTLMTTVGGASGILYATAFLRMAAVYRGAASIDHNLFTLALEKAVEGISHRGNVSYGAKTLLDVWVDVTELFKNSDGFPAADIIEKVAKRAKENTKVSVAKKGKAALYEESSVGHVDPGAASTYYLFVALAETCKENENE